MEDPSGELISDSQVPGGITASGDANSLAIDEDKVQAANSVAESLASFVVPTADWRPQDYEDSQGITAVRYDSAQGWLTADFDMTGQHENTASGEIVLDLKYFPGLEASVPIDMTNRVVTLRVEVPQSFVGSRHSPNGVQVFVKDDSDLQHSQYSPWQNCQQAGEYVVTLQPFLDPPPPFDPSRVRIIGVKLGLGGNAIAGAHFAGQVYVKEVSVDAPLPLACRPQFPPVLPQPHIVASAAIDLRPDGFYFDDIKSFIVGGNWKTIAYGQNFGATAWYPWGNGVSKHPEFVNAKLRMFRQAGVTVVRVGLLDDGRAVLNDDGHVVGFNDVFRQDVTTFLDLAEQNNVRVEFVLVDFLIAGKLELVDRVWLRGRREVIEDSQVREAFLNDFLDPFVREFGQHRAVFGFDVINEPEWIVSKDDGGGWEDVVDPSRDDQPVSGQSLRDFVSLCTEKVREHAPEKPVTVGLSVPFLGLSDNLGLDYLAPHYYPWMGNLRENLSNVSQNEVWILEEFPGRGDLTDYFYTADELGAAGAMVWSLTPRAPEEQQDPEPYTFAEEAGKLLEMRRFLDAGPALVDRHVFYNNSAFDANDLAADVRDDHGIAPDKQALLPCRTATFANYTSYARGINGIMVDIARLPGTPTAEDFRFRVGNDNDPGGWASPGVAPQVTLRPGEGVYGSDRITLVWPDNVIQKQWLEVTVLVTPNTGLAEPDVFYFGNAIGECGNSTTDAKVSAVDMLGARDNQRNFLEPAPIDFNFDFNRDARVNSVDMLIARNNQSHFLNALKLITVPGGNVAGDAATANQGAFPHDVILESEREQGSPGRTSWLYQFESVRPAKTYDSSQTAVDRFVLDK